MKIIALPDLHGVTDGIDAIQDVLTNADLVLLVGDLTKTGNWDEAIKIVRCVREGNTSIFAVPGNWDGQDVARFLDAEKINLHLRKAIVANQVFWGIGGSLPTGFHTPNEVSEETFETLFQKMRAEITPSEPYVLICHQPPVNTINDKAWNGLHVGSKAVRKNIEETQPLICFTGHIHEGVGIDRIGQTAVINPGPLSQGQYGYVEIEGNQVKTLEIRAVHR